MMQRVKIDRGKKKEKKKKTAKHPVFRMHVTKERKVHALGVEASGSKNRRGCRILSPSLLLIPNPSSFFSLLAYSSPSLPLLSCLPQSEPVSESYDE